MYIDSRTWTKDDNSYRGTREKIKHLLPVDVHLPDSKEAKVLRRLKAQTGLTEAEIRSIPKYRWMLARSEQRNQNGPKSHPWYNEKERLMKYIMKTVTKRLKLAKEHPLVVAEFKNEVEKRKRYGTWDSWVLSR